MMNVRVGFVGLAFALAACGGGGNDAATNPNDPYNGAGGGGGGTPSPNAVTVMDNSYTPTSTTVAIGSTVTWTWAAGGYTSHSVTFDAGGSGSTLQLSGTFQRAFPDAGTYNYHCMNHSTMTGTIIVQ